MECPFCKSTFAITTTGALRPGESPTKGWVANPVTDPLPEWACLDIWCGYELDEWRPMWQCGGLT